MTKSIVQEKAAGKLQFAHKNKLIGYREQDINKSINCTQQRVASSNWKLSNETRESQSLEKNDNEKL